jgi:F0F1-type ATP synthase epsilon subunit
MFVEVVSPEESCFSGDATMVISRTPNGENWNS